jgi:uroporphyrinogen-III synthase
VVDLSQVTLGYAPYKQAVQVMITGPTLLLTRPLAQSTAFLEDCRVRLDRPFPAVISPVLKVIPVGDVLDLCDSGTIVVTSANAVRCLADALKGKNVATVGEATAELAASFGAIANCLGETADAFLSRAHELSSPVLVARGVHARVDLAEALTTKGIPAKNAVIYDQIEKPLSSEALALLASSQPVIAPVFSPRSASLLGAYPINAPLTVLAMSAAVAKAWPIKAEIKVAERPDAVAMCDLVTELL